jgi:hypothetical protein
MITTHLYMFITDGYTIQAEFCRTGSEWKHLTYPNNTHNRHFNKIFHL